MYGPGFYLFGGIHALFLRYYLSKLCAVLLRKEIFMARRTYFVRRTGNAASAAVKKVRQNRQLRNCNFFVEY